MAFLRKFSAPFGSRKNKKVSNLRELKAEEIDGKNNKKQMRGSESTLASDCSSDSSDTESSSSDCPEIEYVCLGPQRSVFPPKSRLLGQHEPLPPLRRRRRQVRFIDEAKGLTPRFVVTEVRSRPETLEEDIPLLFYSAREIAVFEQEELYWKLEKEILKIENSDGGCSQGVQSNNELDDDMEEELMRERILSRIREGEGAQSGEVSSDQQIWSLR